MGHYNDKTQVAINALAMRRDAIYKAEQDALETLKLVLNKAGEHGVQIAPVDCIENEYIALSEYQPQTFMPVTIVRYWKGKLEVFMQDYEPIGAGWTFLPSGSWMDYVEAHTDTHLLLDLVIANLEWADGYEDD